MSFHRTTNTPFHAAKQALLDGIQSCTPTAIGIRATDEDYAVLKAYVREVMQVLDQWGETVLHEAKVRSPSYPGSDKLGPIFSQMVEENFGLIEQIETLEIGARAIQQDEERFDSRYAQRQRMLEAAE